MPYTQTGHFLWCDALGDLPSIGGFEGQVAWINSDPVALKRWDGTAWVDVTTTYTGSGGGGGGAPTDAEYLVGFGHAGLSAERVVLDTASVEWNRATPGAMSANIPNDAVSNAMLRNSAASSVIGNPSLSAGNPSDIVASADGQVLRRSSGSLSFGALDNDSITNAMLRNSTANSVIGRSAASLGDPADINATLNESVLRLSSNVVAFGAVNLASANAVTGILPVANGGTGSTSLSTVVLETGKAGGQVVQGGTAASETLALASTADATKGKILFGTSAYDEVNNRLGIGTVAPSHPIHILSSVDATTNFQLENTNATGLNARSQQRSVAATSDVSITAHGSGRTGTRYGIVVGGWGELQSGLGNGLMIGTTSATPIVFGTSNVERLRIAADGTVSGVIAGGTYTPTLTGVTNVTGTPTITKPFGYHRIGTAVSVWGTINVDPTVNAVTTTVRITIPVASNFATAAQLSGMGLTTTGAVQVGTMASEGATDAALLTFTAPVDTPQNWEVRFGYQII